MSSPHSRARARVIIQCEREHSVSCITRVSIKGRYFETTEHLSEYARGCRCKLICGMMAPFRENNLRVASISCVLRSLSSLSLPLSLCFIFSRTLCSFNNELASQKRTICFPCFRLISLFSPLLIFYHLSRDDVFSNKYAGSKSSIDVKYGYISMPMERGCPSSLFPTVLSSSRAPSISVTIRCSELLIAAVMKRGAEAKRRKRLKELASVGNETTAHR